MSKETRVSLLIGLGLIVVFGVVLNEMKGGSPQRAPGAVARQFASYHLSPAVEDDSD